MSERPTRDDAATPAQPSAEREPGTGGERPTAERVGDALGRFGARLGSTAADAGYRLRHAATPHPSDTGPAGVSPAGASQTGTAPAGTRMERAEGLVARAEESVGPFLSVVGRRLQRIAARAREEMEDILAEARHLRTQRQVRAQESPHGEEEAGAEAPDRRAQNQRAPAREARSAEGTSREPGA